MYVRVLTQLRDSGYDVVSSQQLGGLLQMTPAQIRKDLSYFGRFGKQGRGYNVQFLREELRQILGLDRKWPACLIGVGRLGQAIINYPGFVPEGFNVVAAFDSDPEQIARPIGGILVRPMEDLEQAIRESNITIGIVAVPAREAQKVIDQLINAGVRGILNYAPIAPKVSMDIVIRNIDPVLSLQSMTFYLMHEDAIPIIRR
ncbi:MAG: redox-sensing transcriptional repressor Rex [SAR202 cluster bacterium]|nr:redox-sensing transcriptional repressor Rex [SAR202 cluster bacterium]